MSVGRVRGRVIVVTGAGGGQGAAAALLLRDEGARVSYHDPHVAELPDHGLTSVDLDGSIGESDCVAIVTAHSGIDYAELADKAQLVVDFRNATGKNGSANGRVWKL